jgi:hypothetical protein
MQLVKEKGHGGEGESEVYYGFLSRPRTSFKYTASSLKA